MPNEHWFDRLQRRLAVPRARRGLMQSIGALTAGLFMTESSQGSAAKGRKGNKKNKSKHRGKSKIIAKSAPPARCGEFECGFAWPVDAINRNECELKCGRCRDRLKFCIIEGDPAIPDLVATCCFADQTCCPDLHSQSGYSCVDTMNDSDHCGRCNVPCPPGLVCIDGRCLCPDGKRLCGDGCVDTRTDPRNCRECGTLCPDQWTCCDSDCVNTETSSFNCGECGHQCQFGEGAASACCFGVCTDTATSVDHCGRCGRGCPPDRQCCGGICYDPVNFRCCPNGNTACRTDKICCQSNGGGWDCC